MSLKSLVGVLVKYSFYSNLSEEAPADSTELVGQSLKFVQSVKPVEALSFDEIVKEDEDTALSSFSPELIEVITEEEEKVA